jgi:hypothetical protein
MGPCVRRDDTCLCFVIASVSEAIHGAARRKNGLLRRFAPLRKRFAFVAGNDGKKHTFAFSRRNPPEFCCQTFRPPNRGRREYRALGAPAAACAMVEVKSTRVSQVTPETPGIPRAMVYGLFRALPGDRALLPPSLLRSLLLKNLTPASRRQDHTTSPSAAMSFVM